MSTPVKMMRSGKTVAAICDASELEDDARALLDNGQEPKAYVEALIDQELYPEAIRFLAHALPKREAVWWAWVCARRAAGEEPVPVIQHSLDATQQWIAEPTDANRRAAMEHAERAEFSTPAGCAGLAAFFCGDTVGPADQEPFPPGEYDAAKMICGCVMLAAVSTDPEEAKQNFRTFVDQGMEVAEKTKLWDPPTAGA